jgi:hypothetical protein
MAGDNCRVPNGDQVSRVAVALSHGAGIEKWMHGKS